MSLDQQSCCIKLSQRRDAFVLTEKQLGPLGARKTKAAQ